MGVICRLAPAVFMAVALVLFAGCEGDGGGSVDAQQDFGDNNPDLYVAMGDSITHGTGLPDKGDNYPNQLSGLLGKTVIDAGVPGDESWQGLVRMDGILRGRKPGYVLLLYGANDLISGRDAFGIKETTRAMIVKARDNKTVPVLATLTPVFGNYADLAAGVEETSAAIRELGFEEGVRVVDLEAAFDWRADLMTNDGVHPNEAGHKIMAEAFLGAL
ncbi:MAG: hypothetical protein C0404_00475 [Verrucomicrobia bacterium]|nr:hypothetical protein [Verrucomicrobiota bacterium]